MILNKLCGSSDRLEIIEALLNNIDDYITREDIQDISEIQDVDAHIDELIEIGILNKKDNEYKLKKEDKRVSCLEYLNAAEMLRQYEEFEKPTINNKNKKISISEKNNENELVEITYNKTEPVTFMQCNKKDKMEAK